MRTVLCPFHTQAQNVASNKILTVLFSDTCVYGHLSDFLIAIQHVAIQIFGMVLSSITPNQPPGDHCINGGTKTSKEEREELGARPRVGEMVQLAIFRPWALLLHLVRPQLLRNHFFWCRRKEYNQGFQETYTLYTFTRFCTSHRPPNEKKWQKVMFLHFFIFLEPSCKFSSSITDII